MKAISLYNLGRAFEGLGQREDADLVYRQSAEIWEFQNNLASAAKVWNQLGILSLGADKLEESEQWFYKALKADRLSGDVFAVSKRLGNLAYLLQQFPNRLNEAQLLAEESLAIKQTLDPAAAQIWDIYEILAQISDRKNDYAKAQSYRRLSREERSNFAGTQDEINQYAWLIIDTVMAIDDAKIGRQLKAKMQSAPPEWQNLVASIQQVLNGQRDEDILCEGLNTEDSQIIIAILRGISDPETLKAFVK
jgi:tetratricopeptide (TPR) repeat protein